MKKGWIWMIVFLVGGAIAIGSIYLPTDNLRWLAMGVGVAVIAAPLWLQLAMKASLEWLPWVGKHLLVTFMVLSVVLMVVALITGNPWVIAFGFCLGIVLMCMGAWAFAETVQAMRNGRPDG